MGVVERKEREKEEMRQRILHAAQKLFLTKGFEKTSIRNIADAIEYSPSTIYLYFKDKNDLLFALHQMAFEVMTNELSNLGEQPTAFDGFVQMGRQYVKFALENPEMYDLMFLMIAPIESLECNEDLWDDGNRALDLLKMTIEACKLEGYFSKDKTDDLALLIWSTMHGMVTIYGRRRMSMFKETDEENKERINRAFTTFVKYLKLER
jgi:AcrR family transcriptional regulator